VPSSALSQTSNPIGGAAAPVRVLIVAEHASARFGGEAALPLHYLRVMLARGLPVWLITHARVREELLALFPNAHNQMIFIEDSNLHRWMWRLGSRLPARLSYFSTGFVSRLSTQLAQRRLARELIAREGIQVVHQPMPVSPREPSVMHGLGVPVVIGPMNGGMDYPPAFQQNKVRWVSWLAGLGRAASGLMNRLLPGKPRAAALLVANERTRAALPLGLSAKAVVLPENGVDLGLWQQLNAVSAAEASPSSTANPAAAAPQVPRLVFMGRMVDWKAVDLLLLAFNQACAHTPMSLTLIGDGPEGERLRALVRQQGRWADEEGQTGKVFFAGWQPQAQCATTLRRSQVLVLPSLWECGGAVVLEAMACGLPVVATAWGGPLDYLNEECGILVAPSSRQALIDGLAQGMQHLAANPELRARMGAAGRKRIEQEFDWEHKVDEVLALFRRLITSKNLPG
jgi:glycosyltransferase involved in cell wall biosynthesis